MRQTHRHRLNPITLGMTLFFMILAMTLLLIRVMVEAGLSWSAMAQTLGLALIISGLAGLGALTGTGRAIQPPEGSGLPARV
jgi:hypothetical protein